MPAHFAGNFTKIPAAQAIPQQDGITGDALLAAQAIPHQDGVKGNALLDAQAVPHQDGSFFTATELQSWITWFLLLWLMQLFFQNHKTLQNDNLKISALSIQL